MKPLSRFTAFAFLLIVLLITGPSIALAQQSIVRGFITSNSDGLPLQGVNVILTNADAPDVFIGTVSDDDGFYVFSRLDAGVYTLRASFIGFEIFTEELVLGEAEVNNLSFFLEEGGGALDEVVVETERETGAARVTAGLQTVRASDLELIPAPDITADLVSYLSTMPGVISLGDRGGQVFIRGGEPSHNMVLLDGMNVYQPFHLLGFYSAFSGDVLNRADIYAGGYNSQYSGRLSSVIDVKTRNGNLKEHEKAISIAPFVNTARLEGPLIKDKLSILASVRQSVIDRLAAQYVNQELPYKFGDIFGKAFFKMTENNHLTFTFLHTYDRGALDNLDVSSRDEIRWKNTVMGGNWLLLPKNSPLLANIHFSVSRLDMELGPRGVATRTSEIEDFDAGIRITNYVGKTEFNYGGYLRTTKLNAELGGLYQNLARDNSRLPKFGLYLDPNIGIGDNWELRPGFTFLFFDEYGFFPEPRLRAIWRKGQHQVSFASGLYHQELTGLNDRRDATNVFTAWVDSPLEELTRSWHVIAGYRIEPSPGLEVSIEGYHKWLNDLYIAEWTAFPVLNTDLQLAQGTTKGMDIRFEFRRPNFYGFLTYGLSYVNYQATQESLELWYGTTSLDFRPSHDRRHQINALANVKVGAFDISARWNLGSGVPFNQVRGFDRYLLLDGPVDVSEDPGEVRVIYDEPFGGEMPFYHRLDVSIDRSWDFKGGVFSLQAGVINVYDRTNIFALDVFTLEQTDQLPVIPTLGAKIEF